MTVFTDGVQRVVVKTKYAYHYNKAGSFFSRSEFEPTAKGQLEFVQKLLKAGFEKDEQEYREEGSGWCRCLYRKEQETFYSVDRMM